LIALILLLPPSPDRRGYCLPPSFGRTGGRSIAVITAICPYPLSAGIVHCGPLSLYHGCRRECQRGEIKSEGGLAIARPPRRGADVLLLRVTGQSRPLLALLQPPDPLPLLVLGQLGPPPARGGPPPGGTGEHGRRELRDVGPRPLCHAL